MSLFGWLKGNAKHAVGGELERWRSAWTAAIDRDDADVDELRRQLDALAPAQPDVEIELEMLEALDQLRAVRHTVAQGALPAVETGHRVIGSEACHFSATATLPSDQAQTAGRVLLTGARAIFVGGGRTTAAAWHAVHDIVRLERDVLLVRADRQPLAHFRFNTFGDATVCAFLAGHLKRPRTTRL